MQQLLRSEITRTLDMKKLKSILPSYCKVARYDDLLRAKTLKDAMGSHSILVLLFNVHDRKHRILNEPGHFFVISTKKQGETVVFSSTGMSPSKEMFITKSDPSLLDRILPTNTVYNDYKFQKGKESNVCWRWVIIYAHMAQIGLTKFQKLFGNVNLHVSSPDFLSVLLTYILLV